MAVPRFHFLCVKAFMYTQDNDILQKNNQNIALASVYILAVFLHTTHVTEKTAEILYTHQVLFT